MMLVPSIDAFRIGILPQRRDRRAQDERQKRQPESVLRLELPFTLSRSFAMRVMSTL